MSARYPVKWKELTDSNGLLGISVPVQHRSGESEMNDADKQIPSVGEAESGVLLYRPPASWIKRLLWRPRNATASNKDREEPETQHLCYQRSLLPGIILLGLTVMVLLFLWNHQCIFTERLCQGQEESSVFPVFGRP
ncbi:hypothetical protein AAFF_G00064570 [Aldrovandia affinis]|uniref:Uncharacterized protein n=1 Tax=Aldrovandia affinis TaxID=143900 RepID=A0AAD7T3N9_9TELE|nr:hypothetical protein AAFF_G00064570 [Aldrovandia affinis]